MDISPASRKQITAEAVEWFLHFQNSEPHAQDNRALSEWLTRSPAHIEEYLALSQTWTGLAVPDDREFATDALIAAARASDVAGEITNVHRLESHRDTDSQVAARIASQTELQSSLRPDRDKPIDKRPYWRASVGIAVTIVLGCGLWIGIDRWNQAPGIRTVVGEQRSVTLSDGSVVILNTDSEVRLRWTAGERRIDLIKGEGQFHVARDSERPFLVSTADASVRAIGTVFNVRSVQSGTQVAVLEGRVKVSALATPAATEFRPSGKPAIAGVTGPDSLDLDAGHRAAVTVRGIEPDIGPSVEAVAAWTQRRLVFRDQRLADVVEEFNRYRIHRLVIDDAELARLRISGVFNLSDPESLLIYLRSFEAVNVERPLDGSLHLARTAARLEVQK